MLCKQWLQFISADSPEQSSTALKAADCTSAHLRSPALPDACTCYEGRAQLAYTLAMAVQNNVPLSWRPGDIPVLGISCLKGHSAPRLHSPLTKKEQMCGAFLL